MFKLYHKLFARFYSWKLRQLDFRSPYKNEIADFDLYNVLVAKWSYHHKRSR